MILRLLFFKLLFFFSFFVKGLFKRRISAFFWRRKLWYFQSPLLYSQAKPLQALADYKWALESSLLPFAIVCVIWILPNVCTVNLSFMRLHKYAPKAASGCDSAFFKKKTQLLSPNYAVFYTSMIFFPLSHLITSVSYLWVTQIWHSWWIQELVFSRRLQ